MKRDLLPQTIVLFFLLTYFFVFCFFTCLSTEKHLQNIWSLCIYVEMYGFFAFLYKKCAGKDTCTYVGLFSYK